MPRLLPDEKTRTSAKAGDVPHGRALFMPVGRASGQADQKPCAQVPTQSWKAMTCQRAISTSVKLSE